MLKIFDDEYGQMELWMEFFPRDPYELPLDLKEMAEILDRIEVLQPFIDQYRKAAIEAELALTGRNSVPLRTFVGIMVLYSRYRLGYRGTIDRISDSNNWRNFCRIPFQKEAPDYSTICKLAGKFGSEAVESLNKALLEYAKVEKVLKNKKFRCDTTVVESNIVYPTDSGLLAQGIKTINQLVSKIKETGNTAAKGFVFHSHIVKKKILAIVKLAKRRTGEAIREIHEITEQIVKIAEQTVAQARTVLQGAKISISKGNRAIKIKVIQELETVCKVVKQVIDQTKAVISGVRHIKGRIVSIHDRKARPISKGKSGKPVEFGRKTSFSFNEQGFVTVYQVHEGNPNDKTTFKKVLDEHIENTGAVPKEGATDRGYYSSTNEKDAQGQGIFIAMPKIGKKSKERQEYEKQPRFKRLQRFRAGCEGKISCLKRGYRLDKSLFQGDSGTERWVGWGVFAHNLELIPRVSR